MLLVSFLLALSVATGCSRGPKIVPVRGKVLYNGEPLRFGSVMLQPEAGQPARGVIQSDGTFQLTTFSEGDGATVGANRVRVTSYDSQAPDAPSNAGGESALGKLLIPRKYINIHTSGVEVEVIDGDNPEVVIELDDEG